jgi:hypothetical protein
MPPLSEFSLVDGGPLYALFRRLGWTRPDGLEPVATHPDLAGGLGFLSWPSLGFGYVVAALSATQAGVWADQVLNSGVKIMDLKGYALVFVIAALVVALGPLLLVAGHLWRCRYQGLFDYGTLAVDYTRLFQERWIAQRQRGDLLGSADIQSLADLANSYNVVDKMRFWPFGLRTVIGAMLGKPG